LYTFQLTDYEGAFLNIRVNENFIGKQPYITDESDTVSIFAPNHPVLFNAEEAKAPPKTQEELVLCRLLADTLVNTFKIAFGTEHDIFPTSSVSSGNQPVARISLAGMNARHFAALKLFELPGVLVPAPSDEVYREYKKYGDLDKFPKITFEGTNRDFASTHVSVYVKDASRRVRYAEALGIVDHQDGWLTFTAEQAEAANKKIDDVKSLIRNQKPQRIVDRYLEAVLNSALETDASYFKVGNGFVFAHAKEGKRFEHLKLVTERGEGPEPSSKLIEDINKLGITVKEIGDNQAMRVGRFPYTLVGIDPARHPDAVRVLTGRAPQHQDREGWGR
jgi:hypothetical protein